MKNRIKMIASALLAALLVFSLCACEKQKTGLATLEYEKTPEGGCMIIGIGDTSITELAILEKLGGHTVTHIGKEAFRGCTKLTSVTFGKNIVSIREEAFKDCPSLATITVEAGNPVYHSENNCLIATQSHTLVLGCKNSVIPFDGCVQAIGYGAFDGCSDLTSITIPENIVKIEDNAFFGTALSSLILPKNLEIIGHAAFSSCAQLQSVIFAGKPLSMDSWAFTRCPLLKEVTFPGTKTEWEELPKGTDWNTETPLTTVHCTDGDLTIE